MVSHNDTIDVVREALGRQGQPDERTLASAAVLAERLERIKQFGGLLGQVSLSPDMEALLAAGKPAACAAV